MTLRWMSSMGMIPMILSQMQLLSATSVCLNRCSSSFLHVLLAAHSDTFGRREGASLVLLSVLPVIPESGAQLNGRTEDGPTERPKGDEDDSLLVVAVPHGQASGQGFQAARLGGIIPQLSLSSCNLFDFLGGLSQLEVAFRGILMSSIALLVCEVLKSQSWLILHISWLFRAC